LWCHGARKEKQILYEDPNRHTAWPGNKGEPTKASEVHVRLLAELSRTCDEGRRLRENKLKATSSSVARRVP